MRRTPHLLAGAYLDRRAEWRKDETRVAAALRDARAWFVPVWRSRSAVLQGVDGWAGGFIEGAGLRHPDRAEFILLGEFRERACFAWVCSDQEGAELEQSLRFEDLRFIAGELPEAEAGVLAYARAMAHWREQHRYCGRCGARTLPVHGGHVLRCSDAACTAQQFPRIDPAIIVLVTRGEFALLGRQASWPPGRYSTIAGFVEPGESLEDAVRREVREETGVTVDEVDYHSSQPWPFPSSLMLGFMASASSSQIQRLDDELEDARWVTREQIAAGEVALPITHSISFRLIEDWYDSGADAPLRTAPGVRLWRAPRG